MTRFWQLPFHNSGSYELPHDSVLIRDKRSLSGPLGSAPSPAIFVRNAYKSYGHLTPVLCNLSMTVNRGEIYSLLGSSGCGKTTLLQCIIGPSQKLDKGHIFIFGAKRKRYTDIGYMPQETSLYLDFTIGETLTYFGKLYGLTEELLKGRIEFLQKLLEMPPLFRVAGSLSGGQLRRLSLAVTLIHEPKLLLLDEPTARLDPLLRHRIWDYLVKLVETKRTTVLLTTHYNEEARKSHKIGILRGGSLVAQLPPQILLKKFATNSLENGILQLLKTGSPPLHFTDPFWVDGEKPELAGAQCNQTSNFQKYKSTSSVQMIGALVQKNFKRMRKNLLLLLFTTVMPGIILFLSCTTFKHDPKFLKLGIVNAEANYSTCLQKGVFNGEMCDYFELSCKFLGELPTDAFVLTWYDSLDDAVAAVKAGDVWGYLSFSSNYSLSLMDRALAGPEEFESGSTIVVQLDQTNKLIYGKIVKTLYDSFEAFTMHLLSSCGFDERQGRFPLVYKPPILGNDDLTVLDFVAPGLALAWLVCFPSISTFSRYIGEKKQGTIHRNLVAGTQVWHNLVAFSVTEGGILVVQSVLVYLIMRVLFGLGNQGNPVLALGLSIMSGLNGMTFGLALAMICDEEIHAVIIAFATFLPNTFVSGAFWPLEAMPEILQKVSVVLPFTYPMEAMRSIMSRGSEFSHPNVWPGFLVSGLYIVIYLTIAVLAHRRKTT